MTLAEELIPLSTPEFLLEAYRNWLVYGNAFIEIIYPEAEEDLSNDFQWE